MNIKYIYRALVSVLFVAVFSLMTACNTGIESTKTITLSKNERKSLSPSPEEKVLEDIVAPPLSEWTPGIPFVISDDRAAVVFE